MPVGKLVAELIGTFFLVFTVGLTVKGPDATIFAPLAIGTALMVMVYATGHVSGGHLNPAVTLGVTLRGKCTWADAVPYMISQTIGAVAAAALVLFIKGTATGATVSPPSMVQYSVVAKLLVEFLFTFALVYVVLNTATAKGTQGNSFYGLAIGLTVLAGAYAAGPISGAAFNPAVAVGVGVFDTSTIPGIWVPIVADFLGGAAAAVVFNSFDMGGDRQAA